MSIAAEEDSDGGGRYPFHSLCSSSRHGDDDEEARCSEEECTIVELEGPDGGWGWAVVFASFMVHVLADGVTYSFGALTTEFISHFNVSREAVGWLASVLVGMTLSAGPLASILCNRYGFRTVTIAGSIISSIGFSAPFFYPKFWFIFLSASIFTGIGFGLVYLPSIVTVSIYFQKKRAFAIGLAVCGSGIGTFVFSPLIEYFNSEYGWQGSMLLIGGLILNCFACGAVYRPLVEPMSKQTSRNSVDRLCEKLAEKVVNPNKKLSLNNGQNIEMWSNNINNDYLSDVEISSSKTGGRVRHLSSQYHNSSQPYNIPRNPHNKHIHGNAHHLLYHCNQSKHSVTTKPFIVLHDENRCIMSAPDIQEMFHQSTPYHHHHQSRSSLLTKMSHPYVIMSSQISLHLISHRSKDLTNSTNVILSSIPKSDDKPLNKLSKAGSICSSDSSIKSGCAKNHFDLDLFKNPLFLLFAFSNFFTSIGFNAPFLYAKDRALQMGIPNGRASFLISSIGIGNTLGRVLFGYLSTKNFVNRLQLYNGSLMMSGFVVIFSSFALTYPWMISYTLAFGLLTGTYVTLTSVVLVDLLGIEKLNASFGMTMVFQGAAVFIGPPLAGWIFDTMNSFDWSFWVCGGFLALSGIMLYLVYCSRAYRTKEKYMK